MSKNTPKGITLTPHPRNPGMLTICANGKSFGVIWEGDKPGEWKGRAFYNRTYMANDKHELLSLLVESHIAALEVDAQVCRFNLNRARGWAVALAQGVTEVES